MTETAVPFSVSDITPDNRDNLIDILHRFGAKELFATIVCSFGTIDEDCRIMKENRAYFEERGIAFTVWIGGSMAHFPYDREFGKITELDGKKSARICPTDTAFTDYYAGMIKKIAAAGVTSIALDDDFRMNFLDNEPACFCDKHMSVYSELLGHTVTIEDMRKGLYSPAPNVYRTAWHDGIRKTMCDFALKLRKAADEVNKGVNICLCSGPATWGADGADAMTLAKLLAGTNPCRLRLSGGPYWGNIARTADMVRHEAYLCSRQGIFTFTEADAYTRPRYAVPASHIECYDLITRLDGYADGILKYGLDYVSSLEYETGYVKAAERNLPLFREAEELFAGKKQCGIQLYLPVELSEYTASVSHTPEADVMSQPYIRFFNDNSFPVIFDAGDSSDAVNAVFGENARLFDYTRNRGGLILDITAAEILSKRGFDTGFRGRTAAVQSAMHGPASLSNEFFPGMNEKVALYGNVHADSIATDGKAEILSVFNLHGNQVPASYFYENNSGVRMLVYTFDVAANIGVKGLSRSYCRQKQLYACYERMTRKPFDASCLSNPDLYMTVKKTDSTLTVALINLHDDKIVTPEILLGKEYRTAKFLNCDGVLDKSKVIINGTLYPYEFAAFEVTE